MSQTIKLEVVTPERPVFSSDVAEVQFPTASRGYYGILPGHTPLMSEVGDGLLYLLLLNVLAMMLLNTRSGMFFGVLSILTYLSFLFLFQQKLIGTQLIFGDNPLDIRFWVINGITLRVGTNMIAVCGTNAWNVLAGDTVTVTRGGIGTGIPFVDITNAPVTVANDVLTYAVVLSRVTTIPCGEP